jgi:hypothetical protein
MDPISVSGNVGPDIGISRYWSRYRGSLYRDIPDIGIPDFGYVPISGYQISGNTRHWVSAISYSISGSISEYDVPISGFGKVPDGLTYSFRVISSLCLEYFRHIPRIFFPSHLVICLEYTWIIPLLANRPWPAVAMRLGCHSCHSTRILGVKGV